MTRARLIVGCLAAVLVAALAAAFDGHARPAAALETNASATQRQRAAWLWESRIWRTRHVDLLDRAQQLRIDTLFVALEIRDGTVRYQTALRRFLREAHKRNLSVLAVEGDPHMVQPEGLVHAVARAQAIRAYQLSVARRERLDGLQYDIEPYALKNFDLTNPNHLRRWSDAYRALRLAFAQRLDIVLPFWIADTPAGADFVRQAAVNASGLTVMAYRTTNDRIVSAATPLLTLGADIGRPVRVALEMGPTDEGPAVTFDGDLPAVLKAMRETLPVLAQQPSFAGFAIHGLVWPGQEQAAAAPGR